MLLTGLQCHPESRFSLGIDGESDNPSSHVTLVGIKSRKKGCMRPTVPHRDAEPLCTPDDCVGTEFAGRHMLYEKFYAGHSVIVRNQSDREAPWSRFHAIVDDLIERIETPAGPGDGP